jgi:pimeloyl-ACP methyl ester carboxylesterase
MMLVDANAVLPWGDGFYKLARDEAKTFLKLPPYIHEAVVRTVTESACHNPNVLKSGWGDIIAEPWIGTAKRQQSFVRQIAQANDGDVAEMLEGNMYERVRCDVKILWGEKDQWIPREKVEDLMKRIGGMVKEHAFIPDAGHLVMLDQPARFAIEVFDWLTRFGSPRSLTTS